MKPVPGLKITLILRQKQIIMPWALEQCYGIGHTYHTFDFTIDLDIFCQRFSQIQAEFAISFIPLLVRPTNQVQIQDGFGQHSCFV